MKNCATTKVLKNIVNIVNIINLHTFECTHLTYTQLQQT